MHTLFADVAFEEGVLRATFWDYEPADQDRFIDARVRLRGNVGTLFGPSAQMRGVSLFAGKASEIEVLESAPDPFSMAVAIDQEHLQLFARRRGQPAHPHPRRRHDLHSRPAHRGQRLLEHRPLPRRPARALRGRRHRRRARRDRTIAGCGPRDRRRRRRLPGRDARQTHAHERDLPRRRYRAAAGRRCVSANDNVLTPDNDATLVRMEGRFLSVLTQPARAGARAANGRDGVRRQPRASAATERLEEHPPGSLVAVTGVYSYQYGPPPSFRLYLRSADDVRVLAAAPWWTLRHTAVMLAMLTLVAGGRRSLGARRRPGASASSIRPCSTSAAASARELHDTLEQGLAGIALQLEAVSGNLDNVAGGGAAVARRRAPDAALQRGRSAAVGDGSPLAGAREPRPRRRAGGHGAADDARHDRAAPTCASTARRSTSTRGRSIISCASGSKR